MELALSADYGLAQLLRLLDDPCGVLLVHTSEQRGEFLVVRLVDGANGTAVAGLRVLNGGIAIVAVLGVERVARAGVFQLNGSGDVACRYLIDGDTVGACHHVNLRDTLLAAPLHILQIVAALDRTLHDTEIVDLSDMRLDGRLKYIQTGGLGGIGRNADAIDRRISKAVGGRCHSQEEVHQAADTHILQTTRADNGVHRAVGIDGTQAVHDFLVGQPLGEELVEQRLIRLGGLLLQLLAHLGHTLLLGCGDVLLLRRTAVGTPHEHLALKHIDSGIEARTRIDGILDERTFVAELLAQLGEDIIKIRFGGVALVDNESKRLMQLLDHTEAVLRAGLDTLVGRQHDERRAHHLQRRHSAAAEVVRTRAVDDIEFLALELDVANRREHRVTILLFHGEIVANRRLSLNRTATLNHSTLIEHGLHKSGFSRAATTQHSDILNLVSLINFSHNSVFYLGIK